MVSRPERFTISKTFLEKPYVEGDMRWEGETWELNDHRRELVMWYNTEQQAQEALAFVRQYLQRHGDIDFSIFPDSLDTPLRIKNPE